MVIRTWTDVYDTYSPSLFDSLCKTEKPQRVFKAVDLERANLVRCLVCQIMNDAATSWQFLTEKNRKRQAKEKGKGFQLDLVLFEVLALWMGKQHIIRHHRVLFHVASWKGCYWVFERDLWYVRCSMPCERIELMIWVNMCFDACFYQTNVL